MRSLTRNGIQQALLSPDGENHTYFITCASLLHVQRLRGRTYAFGVMCGRSGLRWQIHTASEGGCARQRWKVARLTQPGSAGRLRLKSGENMLLRRLLSYKV